MVNVPNLLAVVILGVAVSAAHAQTPAISQHSSMRGDSSGAMRIGYDTVAAARQALEARDDVRISQKYGWTQIQDFESGAVWSFTPEDHPAHPTVVKRTLVDHGRAFQIVMDGRCEADREPCEDVMRELKRRTMRYQSIIGGGNMPRGGAKADLPALQGLMEMSRAIN